MSSNHAAVRLASDIHERIGLLTRQLHNSMKALGLSGPLQASAGALPDANSRLAYIAKLTGEAAEKVLNGVDAAKECQQSIVDRTVEAIAKFEMDPQSISSSELVDVLRHISKSAGSINEHLTEIMVAQDFHDLTGQVVTNIGSITTNVESTLLQLLIETAPGIQPPVIVTPKDEHLTGPIVNPAGRTDVVANQRGVDDLLASMGF